MVRVAKINHIIVSILCGVFLIACSTEEESYTLVKEIVVSTKEMTIDNLDDTLSDDITRSQLANPGSRVEYLFEDNDTIGIFPEGGFEIPFVVTIPDKIPINSVSFSAGGWRTKDGVKYCSYLPFDRYNFDYSDRVPWTFDVLHQNGNKNGNDTGIKNGLLLATLPTETNEDGTFYAKFTHMGTVLRAAYKLPNPGTFKKACLVAPSARFAINGTYDFYTEGQPFTAGTMSDHFDVIWENLTDNSESPILYAYFILSPDISFTTGEVMTSYVWDDAGIRYRGTYTYKKNTTYKRNGYSTISFVMERESNNLSTYIDDYSNEGEGNGVAIE